MGDTKTIEQQCPRCGGYLNRIPRRMIDRFVSKIVLVYRYRCVAPMCQWQGSLRVRRFAERTEPTLGARE